jgi:hypothetical protein
MKLVQTDNESAFVFLVQWLYRGVGRKEQSRVKEYDITILSNLFRAIKAIIGRVLILEHEIITTRQVLITFIASY